MNGHWGKGLALALWGALVIGTIDNFLRPKLVGERAGLHELLIFFSVLGGLRIWGALGLALGPVVVAITLALLDIFRRVDSDSQIDDTSGSLIIVMDVAQRSWNLAISRD